MPNMLDASCTDIFAIKEIDLVSSDLCCVNFVSSTSNINTILLLSFISHRYIKNISIFVGQEFVGAIFKVRAPEYP